MNLVIRKSVAVVSVVAVSFSNISWAAPADSPIWGERRVAIQSGPAIIKPLTSISVTRSNSPLANWAQSAISPFMTIQAVYRAARPNAPTVLVIQDAHLQKQAQSAIAEAMIALSHSNPSSAPLFVGIEGATAGAVITPIFSSAHKPSLISQIARGLRNAGILNGAESAAFSSRLVELHGVEKPRLYADHVSALRTATAGRKVALENLQREQKKLAIEKQRVFTPELVRFDSETAGYENEQTSITDYAAFLDSKLPVTSPNLEAIVNATQMENTLAFPQIERERNQFLKTLLAKLPVEQMRSLNADSQALKAGSVTPGAYFARLSMLARVHGVSFENVPAFGTYVRYTMATDKIDSAKLFDELRDHRIAVAAHLVENDEQKQILARSRQLLLQGKLIQFTLGSDEWTEYLATPHSSELVAFERFYQLADSRSEAMAKNILNAAESRFKKGSPVVMVAGGFHTNGVVNHLRSAGANVVVVTPRIADGDTQHDSSLDFLTSSRLPLDRLFTGERLFLPTPSEVATRPAEIAHTVDAAATAIENLDGGKTPAAESGHVQAQAHPASDAESPEKGFRVDRDDTGENSVDVVASITGQPFDWMAAAQKAAAGSIQVMKQLYLGAVSLSANTTVMVAGRSWPELHSALRRLNRTRPFEVANLLRAATGFRTGDEQLQKKIFRTLHATQRELGLEDISVYVTLLDSDELHDVGEIHLRGPRDGKIAHELVIGQKFLQQYVIGELNIANAMKSGFFANAAGAEDWLLRDYVAHELIEAFWRQHANDAQADQALFAQMHALLVKHNLSGLAPAQPSVFAMSIQQRLAAAYEDNRGLFRDDFWLGSAPWPATIPFLGSFFNNRPLGLILDAVTKLNPGVSDDTAAGMVRDGFRSGDPVNEIANLALKMAGLNVLNEFNTYGFLSSFNGNVLHKFNFAPNVKVTIKLSDAKGPLREQDLAFVRRYQAGHQTHFEIHSTVETLSRVRKVSSAGIEGRARRLGVTINPEYAEELAIEQFFVHEIAENVLGLSDGDLLDLGIADEARLLAQEQSDAASLTPAQALANQRRRVFLNVDEMVQAVADRAAVSPYGEVNDQLAPVRRVLREAFPKAHPLSYPGTRILDFLKNGYQPVSGGFEASSLFDQHENGVTLVDESASIIHVERLVARLVKESNGAPIVLPVLMTEAQFTGLVERAGRGNQAEQAAVTNLAAHAAKIRIVSLSEAEQVDLRQAGREDVLNGRVVQALIQRFHENTQLSVQKVNILASRSLHVDGAEALALVLRVIVAADIEMLGLDNKVHIAQLLLIQA